MTELLKQKDGEVNLNAWVDLLLSATFLYFIVASISYLMLNAPCMDYANLNYYLLLAAFGGACVFKVYKSQRGLRSSAVAISSLFQHSLAMFGVGAVLAVIYFLRLRYWDHASIWLDEYTQSFAQQSYATCSLTLAAAQQQQPPTDYILHQFAMEILEPSVFSIRLHAMWFSTLSVFLFWGLLIRLKVEKWLVPSLLLFFIAQPILLFHSIEARPISLSIYTLLLFLWYFFEILRGRKNLGLFFCGSLFLYLSSVGLQPMIVCFALAAPLLLLRFKSVLQRANKILLYNVVTVALMLPMFWGIYVQSQYMDQFYERSIGGNVQKLIGGIGAISDISLSTYFRAFSGMEDILTFCLVLCFFFLLRKKFKISRKQIKINLFWLVYLILFLIFFIGAFHSAWRLINWHQAERYSINFYPVVILISAAIISRLARMGPKLTVVGQIICAILAFSISAYRVFSDEHNMYQYIANAVDTRPDWNLFFKDLEQIKGNKVVLSIPYSPIEYFVSALPPASIFSDVKDIKLCRIHPARLEINDFETCVGKHGKDGTIFLVINQRMRRGVPANMNQIERKIQEKYQLSSYENLRVIKIQSGDYPVVELIKALNELRSIEPGGDQNIGILLILLNMLLKNENYEIAKKVLAEIKSLDYYKRALNQPNSLEQQAFVDIARREVLRLTGRAEKILRMHYWY